MNELKQISVVAQELEINPKTICYYDEIGLIPEAQRNTNGYRIYTQVEIDRVSFILQSIPGIREVKADHNTQLIEVSLASKEIDQEKLIAELECIGYQVEPVAFP
jgi:DNA-binding transcriptional MerR regulator